MALGHTLGHEVRAPRGLDCTIAEPAFNLPVREWLARGFVPAKGHIAPSDLAQEASLILPAGNDGPAFLLTRNYFVLKEYNFSDLYVLFIGNLSDRIAGGSALATPWPRVAQASAREIEAMQRRLTELGSYSERIDGKAGMATRVALDGSRRAREWRSTAGQARLRSKPCEGHARCALCAVREAAEAKRVAIAADTVGSGASLAADRGFDLATQAR